MAMHPKGSTTRSARSGAPLRRAVSASRPAIPLNTSNTEGVNKVPNLSDLHINAAVARQLADAGLPPETAAEVSNIITTFALSMARAIREIAREHVAGGVALKVD